jgi:PEGA domain-containing protein
MHSRGLGGWSGIVDDDEGGLGEEAKTDPEMSRVELGLDEPPRPREKRPAVRPAGRSHVEPPAPTRAQVETRRAPERKLKLPLPGEARSPSLDPKRPVPAPPDDAEPPRATRTPPPAPEVVFSSEALVEKLGSSAADPPKPKVRTSWREYREVIRTVAISVFLVSAAVTYKILSSGPSEHDAGAAKVLVAQPPQPAQPSQAQPAQAQPAQAQPVQAQPTQPGPAAAAEAAKAAPPASPQPSADAETPKTPTKTKTPMVSIVSTPPGAIVEIDGILYGKTPVIMPSPVQTSALKVKLQLGGYKKWEELLTPNESGHYNANVQLRPIR